MFSARFLYISIDQPSLDYGFPIARIAEIQVYELAENVAAAATRTVRAEQFGAFQ